jgi:serine protease
MTIALRRLSIGLLAATAIAGGISVAEMHQEGTFGLTATPASLLPATVSTAHPVRVVSTTRDHTGRPVVTVHTATDKTQATTLVEKAQKARNALGVEVDAKITATTVPSGSDPYRTKQWEFTRLHIATAWQSTTGAGVTVAVLDTGVDATQPDLAGQVLPGFDAIAGGGSADSDPNGHGTHVAGVIAADTGNNIGISAIAPNSKILPVRVLGPNGEGYMSAAASGIVYAADNGAQVINMSFDSPAQVDAVSTAIAYARSKGVVVVAAAGNDRKAGSPVSYPAATDGVIAVAATDQAEHVATFSTAGSYVDLAAPGTDILSTWPGGKFVTMSGTSMAAPHVAAIAALLLAKDPTLTPDLVERVMEQSALDRGPTGRDDDYGYGRVDATAALTLLTDLPSVTSTATPTPTPTASKARTVARTRPTIKVAQARQNAAYGDTATTTFTVSALNKPWAQQPVQVCVAPAGTTYTCTADTTSDTGTVTVLQNVSSTYAVKIVTTASDTADAITSPVVTVTAAIRVTVASAAPGSLEVTLTGVAGQTVQVQRRVGTRWTLAAAYPAETDHVLTGLTTGSYRVIVPMTPALLGATSATVAV